MKDEISLNIAILPDSERRNKAIELSKKLASKVPSYFVLDGEHFHPHFTVYQAHYPVRNLEKLKIALYEIARRLKDLEITMTDFKVSHETFVFWSCLKTEDLISAQKEAIGIANPLREGLILPQLKDGRVESEGDKEDIRNYGSLLIGPRYEPHITITRIKNPKDSDKVLEILGEAKRETFRPESLVLAYLGDHGTVTKIIEKVNL